MILISLWKDYPHSCTYHYMSNMARALTYLIAANVQALGFIFVGWWLGEELNKSYPKSFSWFSVTIPMSVLAMFHTYYLVIRMAIKLDKKGRGETPDGEL